MAKYIQGENRFQFTLFPDCIDDFISDDNEVRIIDLFVDSLDLHKLGFKFASLDPHKKGAPSYDPAVLLKIFLYCYPKKIRSSRRIASEVSRNVELMWLTNRLSPDFRTISDFRKDNSIALKNVLLAFNSTFDNLDLFSDLKSLDGSKFSAVNSKDNNFTVDKLVDRIKRIDQQISDYLSSIEHNDNIEDNNDNNNSNISFDDKIKFLNSKKQHYTSLLTSLIDNDISQVSLTDSDSKLMKCNGKMLVGYNVQVVTDSLSHIINDFSISSDPFDNGKIFSSTSPIKKNENDFIEVTVDGGYNSLDDLKDCFDNKIVPILPDGVYSTSFDFQDSVITPDIKKGSTIKDVQTCLRAGVIPDCYSNLNLSLSIVDVPFFQYLDHSISSLSDDERLVKAKDGYFVRCSSGGVFCPQGNLLSFSKVSDGNDIFVGASFCCNCPKKCCKDLYKKLDLRYYQIIKGSSYYKTRTPKFPTVKSFRKQVRLTYIPDKEKYKIRKCTSEHPFGTLKRAHDASYFLTKGIDKVTGEFALSVLGYNLTRIINLVGGKQLINYLKNRLIPA